MSRPTDKRPYPPSPQSSLAQNEPALERTFEKIFTRDEIAGAIALASAADVAFFIKIIKALIRAYAEMRYSPFAIVPLEIALAEQLS